MTHIQQSELLQLIQNQNRENLFMDVYGAGEGLSDAMTRIVALISKCDFLPSALFTAPGRTELGGNHTDHNLGKVLCAAVRNDSLAAAARRDDGQVAISSEGYDGTFLLASHDLNIREAEKGTTNALIRGVLAGIKQAGGTIGGFNACISSDVAIGSGLSSSASFEVLIGTIVNYLYNDASISPEKIARIGQYAENTFFGKPCGLMDQTASAVGGIIKIDFKNPQDLLIKKLEFLLDQTDYRLIVVNSGSNHADLTPAYASIPAEMRQVAKAMGFTQLREMDETEFRENIQGVRAQFGDRAVLRASHFYAENHRVDRMATALEQSDILRFLAVVKESGSSSQNLLQNVIPPSSDGREQGLAYALGLSQLFFEERGRGVARVHGGGFAGTIQAYVHKDDFADYESYMASIFGEAAVAPLHFRQSGACQILNLWS